MHFLIFILSAWLFSFSTFSMSELMTSLEEKTQLVKGREIEFSGRFNSERAGRILAVSLRDSQGNLVKPDVGSISLRIPSEGIRFDPARRIVQKVEHNRRFFIKIAVNNPAITLDVHLITEEPPKQKKKKITFTFSRAHGLNTLVSSAASQVSFNAPVPEVDTHSEDQVLGKRVERDFTLDEEIKPKKFCQGFPLEVAPCNFDDVKNAVNTNPFPIEVSSRQQKSRGWFPDELEWSFNASEVNHIGKGRKIEVNVATDTCIEAYLEKVNQKEDFSNALKLSLEQNGEAVSAVRLNHGVGTFYIKKVVGIKFIAGEEYRLVIKAGDRITIYRIALKNHHFEADRHH